MGVNVLTLNKYMIKQFIDWVVVKTKLKWNS